MDRHPVKVNQNVCELQYISKGSKLRVKANKHIHDWFIRDFRGR